MKDIKFQQKYIAKITDTAVELLNDQFQDESTVVFQAPTGSGKTYMMSQALTEIVKKHDKELAFIWISINKLHEQSRENLSRYLEDERLLDCISVDEILDNEIEQNQIVFINWESLNKDNAVFRTDNERDFNLKTVCENTREAGRKLILIIDESHRAADTKRAEDIKNEISATLTIHMSATPKPIQAQLIKIPLREVIDEGIIKQEVQINPDGKTAKENKDLLDLALKKRKSLKRQYEALGKDINPLLLVQIPNKKIADATNPEDYIVGLLADHNITLGNKRLAIWLSDLKENKEFIEAPNSEVEVLIFKEAIATGWDCPRAAILFLQREWKTERYTFNVQTLGRIMRMPEQEHYENSPDLNVGYVYSASDNFEIVQELAADYASSVHMKRDTDLYAKPVRITSEFVRRKREQTRLSGDFKKCFFDAADALRLKDNINADVEEIQREIGTDGLVTEIDRDQLVTFVGKKRIRIPTQQIANEYSNFTVQQSLPYAAARSSKIIKTAIRSWFKATYNIDNENQVAMNVIQRNNRSEFKEVLDKAKEFYGNLPTKADEIVPNEQWEVPLTTNIYGNYTSIKSAKSILKNEENNSLCVKTKNNDKADLSKPEIAFLEYLESSDDEIQWWFRNGVSESKYFGIAYKKPDGHLYGFYPDFIIKTKKEVLIIEIKDNKALNNENWRKYQAGKEYPKKYRQQEKTRFYMLSPDDFESFFLAVKGQELDKFKSAFEASLLRYSRSEQKVLENKPDKTDEENLLLETYEQELEKTIKERDDALLEKELLAMDLKQAQENIKAITVASGKTKKEAVKLEIPKPFNICVLGEVSDADTVVQELQAYFTKHSVKPNEWRIDFVNNTKLKNSNALKSLVKGQSKYDLIITGQIHHHAGKGNSKSNIISELANYKYVPHVVGVDPKSLLTPDRAVEAVDKYLAEKD